MNFLHGFADELIKISSGENDSDVTAQDFADLGQWDKGLESAQENGNPVVSEQVKPRDVELLNTRQGYFMGRFMNPEPSRRSIKKGILSKTDG